MTDSVGDVIQGLPSQAGSRVLLSKNNDNIVSSLSEEYSFPEVALGYSCETYSIQRERLGWPRFGRHGGVLHLWHASSTSDIHRATSQA